MVKSVNGIYETSADLTHSQQALTLPSPTSELTIFAPHNQTMHKVLILGSGGREHALAWKIAQSPLCEKLYIGPGNAGTSEVGTNIAIDILDFKAIERYVDRHKIDFLVVGPEAPLVKGIYDHFAKHKVKVIGPSKVASQLEGSKSFANDFMRSFNIPTAASVDITKANLEEGYATIDKQKGNIVLKADGLAAGKGVLILEDKAEAKRQLKAMIEGKFGAASETVVIEQFMDGIEFSVFVATDGKSYQVLPIAKDYKRIGEGDTGLNTGGMGAISPVPFVDEALMAQVKEDIIEPTIEGLKIMEYPYKGFIFLGLILVKGKPYVIEYNCRLGDPETEVILPRMKSDLLELFAAMHDGSLADYKVKMRKKTAATIMLVSQGYPGSYPKGKEILIDQSMEGSIAFHAGTKKQSHNTVTNGGRVIAVTSLAKNHKKAVKKSLENISKIHFDGMNYRTDIGFDL